MFTRSKHLPVIVSLLVALAGFVSLAQVLAIHIRHYRYGQIDDSLLPFTALQTSRLFILGAGILLLYLSVQIYRRKLLAYQLVTIGLVLLIGAEFLRYKNWAQVAFYTLTLLLLLLTRRQYVVASDNQSLRRGAGMAGIIIAVVFVYATIGFATLNKKDIDTSLGLPVAIKYAAREIFTFQESQVPLHSRHARWFVTSVNSAAAVAYTLAIISLFRPLRFQYGASRHDRASARRIVAASSTSTEDYFKLWPPDKHYFFQRSRDSFVGYKVVGSDALVLGGPVGREESFKGLLADFTDFCHRNGWSVAIINAPDTLDAYLADGYQRLFIGNEAIIDTDYFTNHTSRSKHFRYIKNRALRDNTRFEYWQAPLKPEQVTKLRRVSDAWLQSGSRREYTFALGYFDSDYIRSCDVAVLTNDDHIVAYANVLPGRALSARTIDHMRHIPDMTPTGMHYLLMQLVLYLRNESVREFNLGLAPLSGIKERTESSIPERLLAVLKRLGSRYYSFGGLEQFKNKFEPNWQPRYIYYQGSTARLLRLAGSLGRATAVPLVGRWRRRGVLGLSIAAAACYASFPLAYLLDPPHALEGLASELGSSGQAYAGLFNGLDIASSVFIFIVIWLVWGQVRAENRLLRWAAISLGLGAIGTLLAAVTPLSLHDIALQDVMHDMFSVLSLFGAAGAALCLVAYRRMRSVTYGSLFILLLTFIIISGIAENSILDSTAQRAQIVLTGIWFILIGIRLAGASKQPPITRADES